MIFQVNHMQFLSPFSLFIKIESKTVVMAAKKKVASRKVLPWGWRLNFLGVLATDLDLS